MKSNKNILVCHLLLGAANEVAGIQRYIASLADSHSLVVINKAPEYEKYLRQNKVNYYVYNNFNEFKKIIIKKNIQIVHAHLGKAAVIGWQLKRAWPPIKLVYTQHFIDPAYTKSKIYLIKKIIYKKIFNSFDKVIAISGVVKSAILRRGEVAPKKIQLVYNGIAFPEMKMTKRSPQKKIITVCRLEKEKRPFLILDLAAMLPEYHFLVVGAGALLNKLKVKAPANVKFIGYQKNIFDFLQKNSLFFLPAQAEPFGLVLVEALFAGLPVIAFNSGAVPEIISKKEGFLLSNEKELIKAKVFIENLYQNKKKYINYSLAARKKAEFFSLNKMKEEIALIYEEVLK